MEVKEKAMSDPLSLIEKFGVAGLSFLVVGIVSVLVYHVLKCDARADKLWKTVDELRTLVTEVRTDMKWLKERQKG